MGKTNKVIAELCRGIQYIYYYRRGGGHVMLSFTHNPVQQERRIKIRKEVIVGSDIFQLISDVFRFVPGQIECAPSRVLFGKNAPNIFSGALEACSDYVESGHLLNHHRYEL